MAGGALSVKESPRLRVCTVGTSAEEAPGNAAPEASEKAIVLSKTGVVVSDPYALLTTTS